MSIVLKCIPLFWFLECITINQSIIKSVAAFIIFTAVIAVTSCGDTSSFRNSDGNTQPTAYDISITTLINTPVDIILQATDPDNQSLTYRITDNPDHGILVQKTYNVFRYTPAADYEGSDSFRYRVNDGKADSNSAVVSILMGVPNHAPVAHDASISTPFNTGCNVTLTVTDADNDLFEITIIQDPEHGTINRINENTYYYTPADNYYGTDTILFQAADEHSTGNIGKITITIAITNSPPVAAEVSATIAEDTPFILPFAVDLVELWDSETLYEIVIYPDHGTVSFDNGNNHWIYTPETDYNGTVSFYYRAYDGIDYSDKALVTLYVSPAPDAPVVSDRTVIVTEPVTQYNIMLQGSDPDGDALTFTLSGANSLPGSLNHTGGNDEAVYTSPADISENYGLYLLTYTASDGTYTSNTGTIYVVIRPENVWFVNPGNTGARTGQCWHQGFVYISEAVAEAQPGDQIWILGGATHRLMPGTGGERILADLAGKTEDNTGLTLIGGFPMNSYNIEDSGPIANTSIIDGENIAEHVIRAGSNCVIRNVTITRGNARGTETFNRGGGIFVPDAMTNIIIDNVIIHNSHAVSGGGIYIGSNCSAITVTDSVLYTNDSEIRGGGCAIAEYSEVLMNNCLFNDNETLDFGGGLSNMGTLTAEDCTFSGNTAQYGGGLYDHHNPSVYTNCIFRDNTAAISGGGIFNFGSITLSDCAIGHESDYSLGNSAKRGAGIFNDASGIADMVNVDISNCIISHNTSSQNGAGIYNLRSKVLLHENCEISYNKSIGTLTGNDGGGIYCTEGTTLVINNSTIRNNSTEMNGGGIYADGYSDLTLNNTTLSSNQAQQGRGGAVYLSQAYARLNDSTVDSNRSIYGGGFYLINHSRLYFAGTGTVYPYTYIRDNNSERDGGGIYSEGSLIEITKAHILNNVFNSPTGNGGGIYAAGSSVTLNQVYVEMNHGPQNESKTNYSGYYLTDSTGLNISLLHTVPGYPDTSENYFNYLTIPEEPYISYDNQFYPAP